MGPPHPHIVIAVVASLKDMTPEGETDNTFIKNLLLAVVATESKLDSKLGETPKMPQTLRIQASVSVNSNRRNTYTTPVKSRMVDRGLDLYTNFIHSFVAA